MSQYTFTSIVALVTNFVKVNVATTELATLVSNAVDVAFFDTARENRWPELLKINQTLAVTNLAAGTPVNLDADCMLVERVRFASPTNNPPFRAWRLFPRGGMVPPAPIFGKPRAYVLTQSATSGIPLALLPDPYTAITSSDTLKYDYYKAPALFSTTPTLVFSNLWDTEIIKRAINWTEIYLNKLDQAKAIWATLPGQSQPQQQQSQS